MSGSHINTQGPSGSFLNLGPFCIFLVITESFSSKKSLLFLKERALFCVWATSGLHFRPIYLNRYKLQYQIKPMDRSGTVSWKKDLFFFLIPDILCTLAVFCLLCRACLIDKRKNVHVLCNDYWAAGETA